jgi:pilus assembly protein Flp/PilA
MNTMLMKMYVKYQDLMSRDEGQDLVEYALLVALLSLIAVGTISQLGSAINTIFGNILKDI